MRAAYGHGKCDDINQVFPKNEPSKVRVDSLVKKVLLTQTLEDIKKSDGEDKDRSYIMKIDAMFEKLKENADSGAGADDGISDNVGDDNTNNDEPVFSYNKKKPAQTNLNTKITLIDLLLSDKYSRDEKIQIINDVFTRSKEFSPLKGDEVTVIGSTFLRYGESEPYLNHCIIVGECDPVDGVVIESVDYENDLLLKWTEIIQKENPDIIIGYNIFGFDYEFMFRRAQENH